MILGDTCYRDNRLMCAVQPMSKLSCVKILWNDIFEYKCHRCCLLG